MHENRVEGDVVGMIVTVFVKSTLSLGRSGLLIRDNSFTVDKVP
jgi:hypothetical protein